VSRINQTRRLEATDALDGGPFFASGLVSDCAGRLAGRRCLSRFNQRHSNRWIVLMSDKLVSLLVVVTPKQARRSSRGTAGRSFDFQRMFASFAYGVVTR
jgi:hypothetical protein